MQSGGSDWTTTKETSAAAAATEWRTETHYNPTFDPDAGLMFTFVDGRQPPCGNFTSSIYAATCVYTTLRYYPNSTEAWLDIHTANVYLNKDDFTWNHGSSSYDPGNPRPSFRGVLTHEYGHVAGLRHESSCGSPLPTMCPSVTYSQTYQIQSLEAVDISSVNNRY